MSVVIDRLSVSYRPGAPVLTELSLQVAAGEWLGLLGPNGAGKSTLLRAIAGLVEHEGSIHLAGTDAASLRRRDRARRLAFVPQEPVIPPGITVTEYVLLGRTPHLPYLGTEGRGDLAMAASALTLLDLEEFGDRGMAALSGGERRRVVLARAIAQQADILLLDEPTGALDIGQGQNALELIGYLRKERPMTIITAMHDLTLAGQFADRLLLMAGGRIVAEGPAAQVLTAEYIREFYQANVEVVSVNSGVAVLPVRNGAR
ncbi:ABC transporter ATP-binding protein [Candidatus Spongiisocius sp.]|uniref:ABC transporter ATP-binding protein n=1 Tax=Candidatus Spongiisocius sp. TaxID=3101273 RepID=UPI003B5A6738